jgi:DNA helicase-2/ATP-dependent DNA helicase PcrA
MSTASTPAASNERIADLHIHSHYSRATSRDLTFEHLARWAQLKGVQIVGTGDIAHPGWLAEMHASLEPAEEGLFRLKPEIAQQVAAQTPAACQSDIRFMLVGEISNIYKRHDAVRKVHNLIFAPSLDVVAQIQQRLERIGNIRADGRPILGLDSRDLLEIVLDVDARCALIPAHIWTPWFSMLGSKSGFDTVEECLGDLTSEIFALETGLSSDPPMNWLVSNLDRYTLVSNSDAHSPQKLAREATILRCEPAYDAIMNALRSGDIEQFGGTLEFFPEEGKYHLDGHRKCGVCWEPPTTIAHNSRCPVCGKEVTIGVMHRVEVLADRPVGEQPARTAPFDSMVPLPEILGEIQGVGSSSRRVQQEYEKLLAKLGPELTILRHVPLEEIAAVGGSRLAEAIGHIRRGEIVAQGGYDGEYGTIRIFGSAAAELTPQLGLFVEETPAAPATSNLSDLPPENNTENNTENGTAINAGTEPVLKPERAAAPAQLIATPPPVAPLLPNTSTVENWLDRLNAEQRAAATCVDAPLIIVAGPGTGKTRTLTVRIAHLLAAQGVAPEAVLAITFTNKAAEEMRARLLALVGEEMAQRLTISTFHAFGAQLLRAYGERLGLSRDFAILDDDERAALLRRALPDLGEQEANRTLAWISHVKNRLLPLETRAGSPAPEDHAEMAARYHVYQQALDEAQAVDFDDLVRLPVQLLTTHADVANALHARYRWLSVDEYQDVNPAQYQLLRALAADGANVCVIGDPDQAIYSFRGADPAYFHRFANDFPGAVTVELRQSYRSPHALLEAASQVIANNPDRPQAAIEGRRLWSEFTHEVKLEIYPAASDRAEAEYLVHTIEQAVGGTSYFSLDSGRVASTAAGNRTFGDFAILYRLGVQRRALIEAFDRSGIPYQIVGDALTDHRHIRHLLALLRLRDQPAHPLLPLTTLLGSGKAELSADALQWLAEQVTAQGVESALRHAATAGSFKPAQRRKIGGLLALWVDWPATMRLDEMVPPLHAAWGTWQGENTTVAQNERVAQLRLRAVPFGTQIGPFLDQMALQRGADTFDPRADRVALMSLHAAKGLEFPVVFMVGCEEGLLPYLPPTHTREDEQENGYENTLTVDIAEERRLFYVGMTRAQETLTLTYAGRRLLFGQMVTLPPSRFVDEIEAARKAMLTPSQLPKRYEPKQHEKVDDLQLKLF